MSGTQFVHLRLHSEFSVVDGIVRIDEAVGKAAADGQGALALTDSANVFGAVRFYQAARKRGIKPIIGCDVWVTNDTDRDNPHRLLLLTQDRTGYLNLCALLTRAFLENQHRSRAELRLDWLEADAGTLARGLIALSGARLGEIGAHLMAGKGEAATLAAQRHCRCVSRPFLPRTAAHRRASRPGVHAGDAGPGYPAALASGCDAPDPVPRARRFPRARGAVLHRRGLHAR